MIPEKEQIDLLQGRRISRLDFSSLRPSRENLAYLLKFFGQQKKHVQAVLFFIFFQSLLELFLVSISYFYLKNNNLEYSSASQIFFS